MLTRRRRSLKRLILLVAVGILLRLLYLTFSWSSNPKSHKIREQNVLERVRRSEKTLNVQKHDFLQVRMGRDERDDLLTDVIKNGADDYWERFQKP